MDPAALAALAVAEVDEERRSAGLRRRSWEDDGDSPERAPWLASGDAAASGHLALKAPVVLYAAPDDDEGSEGGASYVDSEYADDRRRSPSSRSRKPSPTRLGTAPSGMERMGTAERPYSRVTHVEGLPDSAAHLVDEDGKPVDEDRDVLPPLVAIGAPSGERSVVPSDAGLEEGSGVYESYTDTYYTEDDDEDDDGTDVWESVYDDSGYGDEEEDVEEGDDLLAGGSVDPALYKDDDLLDDELWDYDPADDWRNAERLDRKLHQLRTGNENSWQGLIRRQLHLIKEDIIDEWYGFKEDMAHVRMDAIASIQARMPAFIKRRREAKEAERLRLEQARAEREQREWQAALEMEAEEADAAVHASELEAAAELRGVRTQLRNRARARAKVASDAAAAKKERFELKRKQQLQRELERIDKAEREARAAHLASERARRDALVVEMTARRARRQEEAKQYAAAQAAKAAWLDEQRRKAIAEEEAEREAMKTADRDVVTEVSPGILGVYGVPMADGEFHALKDGGFKPELDGAEVRIFSEAARSGGEDLRLKLAQLQAMEARLTREQRRMRELSRRMGQESAIVRMREKRTTEEAARLRKEVEELEHEVSGPGRRAVTEREKVEIHKWKSNRSRLLREREQLRHRLKLLSDRRRQLGHRELLAAKQLAVVRERRKACQAEVDALPAELPMIVGHAVTSGVLHGLEKEEEEKKAAADSSAVVVVGGSGRAALSVTAAEDGSVAKRGARLAGIQLHTKALLLKGAAEGMEILQRQLRAADHRQWKSSYERRILRGELDADVTAMATLQRMRVEHDQRERRLQVLEAIKQFIRRGEKLKHVVDSPYLPEVTPLNWWQGRDVTAVSAVEALHDGRLRLASAASGFAAGSVALPGKGPWLVELKVSREDPWVRRTGATTDRLAIWMSGCELQQEDTYVYPRGGPSVRTDAGLAVKEAAAKEADDARAAQAARAERLRALAGSDDRRDAVQAADRAAVRCVALVFNSALPGVRCVEHQVARVIYGDSLSFRFVWSGRSIEPLDHLTVSIGRATAWAPPVLRYRPKVDRLSEVLAELFEAAQSEEEWMDSDIMGGRQMQRFKRTHLLQLLLDEVQRERQADEDRHAAAMAREALSSRLARSREQFAKRKEGEQHLTRDVAFSMVGKHVDVYDEITHWRLAEVLDVKPISMDYGRVEHYWHRLRFMADPDGKPVWQNLALQRFVVHDGGSMRPRTTAMATPMGPITVSRPLAASPPPSRGGRLATASDSLGSRPLSRAARLATDSMASMSSVASSLVSWQQRRAHTKVPRLPKRAWQKLLSSDAEQRGSEESEVEEVDPHFYDFPLVSSLVELNERHFLPVFETYRPGLTSRDLRARRAAAFYDWRDDFSAISAFLQQAVKLKERQRQLRQLRAAKCDQLANAHGLNAILVSRLAVEDREESRARHALEHAAAMRAELHELKAKLHTTEEQVRALQKEFHAADQLATAAEAAAAYVLAVLQDLLRARHQAESAVGNAEKQLSVGRRRLADAEQALDVLLPEMRSVAPLWPGHVAHSPWGLCRVLSMRERDGMLLISVRRGALSAPPRSWHCPPEQLLQAAAAAADGSARPSVAAGAEERKGGEQEEKEQAEHELLPPTSRALARAMSSSKKDGSGRLVLSKSISLTRPRASSSSSPSPRPMLSRKTSGGSMPSVPSMRRRRKQLAAHDDSSLDSGSVGGRSRASTLGDVRDDSSGVLDAAALVAQAAREADEEAAVRNRRLLRIWCRPAVLVKAGQAARQRELAGMAEEDAAAAAARAWEQQQRAKEWPLMEEEDQAASVWRAFDAEQAAVGVRIETAVQAAEALAVREMAQAGTEAYEAVAAQAAKQAHHTAGRRLSAKALERAIRPERPAAQRWYLQQVASRARKEAERAEELAALDRRLERLYMVEVRGVVDELVAQLAAEVVAEDIASRERAAQSGLQVLGIPRDFSFASWAAERQAWVARQAALRRALHDLQLTDEQLLSIGAIEPPPPTAEEAAAAALAAAEAAERAAMAAEEAQCRSFYTRERYLYWRERHLMRAEEASMRAVVAAEVADAEQRARNAAVGITDAMLASKAPSAGKAARRKAIKLAATERRVMRREQPAMAHEDHFGRLMRADRERMLKQDALLALLAADEAEVAIDAVEAAAAHVKIDDGDYRAWWAVVDRQSVLLEVPWAGQALSQLVTPLFQRLLTVPTHTRRAALAHVQLRVKWLLRRRVEGELELMLAREAAERPLWLRDMRQRTVERIKAHSLVRSGEERRKRADAERKRAAATRLSTRLSQMRNRYARLEAAVSKAQREDDRAQRAITLYDARDYDGSMRCTAEKAQAQYYSRYFRTLARLIALRAEIAAAEAEILTMEDEVASAQAGIEERQAKAMRMKRAVVRKQRLRMRRRRLGKLLFGGEQRRTVTRALEAWKEFLRMVKRVRSAYLTRYELLRHEMLVAAQLASPEVGAMALSPSARGPAAKRPALELQPTLMERFEEREVTCKLCEQRYRVSRNHAMACYFHPGEYKMACPRSCKKFQKSCMVHFTMRWTCCDDTEKVDGPSGCSMRWHVPTEDSTDKYDQLVERLSTKEAAERKKQAKISAEVRALREEARRKRMRQLLKRL